jgi:anthranilate/para-aminobenzoate synthase component II
VPATYHLPGLFGIESLAAVDLQRAAGIIVLGSGASVNDDLAWQDELRGWLRAAMAARVPILGLCYGHQLLANMAGASVGFAQPSREKFKGPAIGAPKPFATLGCRTHIVVGRQPL